jgi:hypothetical protein
MPTPVCFVVCLSITSLADLNLVAQTVLRVCFALDGNESASKPAFASGRERTGNTSVPLATCCCVTVLIVAGVVQSQVRCQECNVRGSESQGQRCDPVGYNCKVHESPKQPKRVCRATTGQVIASYTSSSDSEIVISTCSTSDNRPHCYESH